MLSKSLTRRAARVPRQSSRIRQLGLCAALGALGCFKPDDGREPPLDRIYFPTALALSPDGDRLYVVNSDWDLQFNAGSLQVYDTARVRELLPRHCASDADCNAPAERCDLAPVAGSALPSGTHWCVDAAAPDPCRGLGVQPAGQRFVEPGLCGAVDNTSPELLLDSVGIGAFATGLVYRSNPAGGGRLFVPVRSDATLHWVDVRGGSGAGGPERELDCGQGDTNECDAAHRQGDGATEETRDGTRLPIEPYGADATDDGTAIVVTHQTEGALSLFVNDWASPDGPRLASILDGLPQRPVHVRAIPPPAIARLDRAPGAARALEYKPGFWTTFRGGSFVQLVRYFDEIDSPSGVPFLEPAFADRLLTTATSDVIGLTIDPTSRDACEAACGAADAACLELCASVPLDVFLANRIPSSILIGRTTSLRRGPISTDRLQVSDAVSVDEGLSSIVLGDIIDGAGVRQRRVFSTSFDARSLTIYDPLADRIEARVLTGRGPSAVAIDGARGLAYVAHFTDSYIGVIDLDQRHTTFGTLILALGEPTAPRGGS